MMMMLWSQVELSIRLPADVDPQTCRRRLELLNSRHRRYDGGRSSDLTDFSQLSNKRSWRPQNVSCWFFHSSQLAIRSLMHNWIDLNETSDFVYLLFPLRLCFRFFVVCLANNSIHKTQRSLSLWIFFLDKDGWGRRRRLWMLYYGRNETIEQEGWEKTMEKREYQSGQSEMS